MQTIFICLAGGCLGVLFLIPLRRYFAREMHGKLPFPEATAITEVLVTGEKGGSQAKLLLQATAIAGVYDFFVTTFHVWKEYLDFQFVPAMRSLADSGRMVFSFDAISFIMGLGYVMGMRSALTFCAGSVLTSFVLVPLIWYFGSHIDAAVYPGVIPIAKMTAAEIVRNYVRFIGVGAIAMAGILGILKSLRVVAGSFGIALRTFRHGEAAATERTDRDISIVSILLGVVVSSPRGGHLLFTPAGLLDGIGIGRGLDAGILVLLYLGSRQRHCHYSQQSGLRHDHAHHHRLLCRAVELRPLRRDGNVLRDGHCGHGMHRPMHIRSVHYRPEGRLLARLHARGPGESETHRRGRRGHHRRTDHRPAGPRLSVRRCRETAQILPAPQAAIMKALVVGFMSRQPVAYILFGIGAIITLILEMLGKSSMVFALGIYLPLALTSPVLAGGILSHFVNKRSEKTGGEQGSRIRERGVILASGLMAGGALGGVLGAALHLFPWYRGER